MVDEDDKDLNKEGELKRLSQKNTFAVTDADRGYTRYKQKLMFHDLTPLFYANV